jgi:hypothetical protein
LQRIRAATFPLAAPGHPDGFSLPSLMTIPKKYLPVGRCIYCGARRYSATNPAARFGDEHIIPLAFGGNLLLPEASCQECEAITSGLETHCIEQMVRNTREHLGLIARRHKRNRKHLPVSVRRGAESEVINVPVDQHPAALIMFSFDPPRLLFDEPDPEGSFVGRVVIKPLSVDLGVRADRIGGKVELVRRGGFDATIFARMIAKIAHAYAVAELKLNGFRPILADFIRSIPARHASQYVGGEWGTPEPAGCDRHEIRIDRWSGLSRDYHVVRLRLFSDQDMPTYLVVVGEPLTQPPLTASLAAL